MADDGNLSDGNGLSRIILVSLLEEQLGSQGHESLSADFDEEQSRHESVLLSLSAIVEKGQTRLS